MFGLSRSRSAFVWLLLLWAMVSLPYAAVRFYDDVVGKMLHGSADVDLAKQFLEGGAVVVVVPSSTKGVTVTDPAKIPSVDVKVATVSLDDKDDPALLDMLGLATNLRTLTLKKISFQDRSLLSLLEEISPELTSLKLIDVANVEERGLVSAIALRFPNLKSLEAPRLPLSDDEISALGALPKLRTLNLSSTELGDAGIAALRTLQIETLKIGSTSVTSAGLRSIPPTVRSLYLASLPVTDTDIAYIAQALPDLATLSLQGTAVTDASVPSFLQMANLRVLQVKGSKMSPEGMASLQAAKPDLKVQ